jgi:hypothetical protein
MCARGTATLWHLMEGVYGWFHCMASAKVTVQVRLYGLWLVPHCLMFCGKKVFGCEVVSPLSSQYHKFVGYAFVDDTDIIQSSLTAKEHQVLESLQVAIDTWEHSLKATCCAIVPEKTAWWLVSFRWSSLSWQYASIQDSPGELYFNDSIMTENSSNAWSPLRHTKRWVFLWHRMVTVRLSLISFSR